MKKSVAMKWVANLRSGKYPQGEPGLLKSQTGYCCLGVLCETVGLSPKLDEATYCYDGAIASVPLSVKKISEIKHRLGNFIKDYKAFPPLSALNDEGTEYLGRLTFDEIADIIQICYKEL